MQNGKPGGDPPPPPEMATWNIERPSPDVLAWASQTFDMEEYLAAVREMQETGGVGIDDLIEELERRLHGSS